MMKGFRTIESADHVRLRLVKIQMARDYQLQRVNIVQVGCFEDCSAPPSLERMVVQRRHSCSQALLLRRSDRTVEVDKTSGTSTLSTMFRAQTFSIMSSVI